MKKDEDKVEVVVEEPKKEEETVKVEEESKKAEPAITEEPKIDEEQQPNELDALKAELLALKTEKFMSEIAWLSDEDKVSFNETFASFDIEAKKTIADFLQKFIVKTKEQELQVKEETVVPTVEDTEPSKDEVSALWNS